MFTALSPQCDCAGFQQYLMRTGLHPYLDLGRHDVARRERQQQAGCRVLIILVSRLQNAGSDVWPVGSVPNQLWQHHRQMLSTQSTSGGGVSPAERRCHAACLGHGRSRLRPRHDGLAGLRRQRHCCRRPLLQRRVVMRCLALFRGILRAAGSQGSRAGQRLAVQPAQR